MSVKLCKVEGCGNVAHARGLCRRHYSAAAYRGELDAYGRHRAQTECSVCGKAEVGARGMCWAHYQVWRRTEGNGYPRRVEPCIEGRKLHEYTPRGKCLHCGYVRQRTRPAAE